MAVWPFVQQTRSAQDDTLVILGSCLGFTVVYFFLKAFVFPTYSAVFNNRMASLVHALLMLPVSAAVIDFKNPWADLGIKTTDSQAVCLSITAGYFIYDTIGVYLIEHDWGNSLHHVASFVAFAVGIFQRQSGSELAWSLFLMEISNPLLHLRAYMKETNKTGTAAAEIVNALFALSFLVCRLIFGPLLTWRVLCTPTSSLIVKAGGSCVQLVSFYWAWQIVRIALFKFRQASKQSKD